MTKGFELHVIQGPLSKFIFYLRPRRFGKSLFVSMLEHYYALEYKNQFNELFDALNIGKNPTPLANQYMVLPFEFTGIQTIFDARNLQTVVSRSLKPSLAHEKTGQYQAGTTFAEGLVYFKHKWFLYYGTADSFVGLAIGQ
jgi:Predicted AAA-ATPase